MWHKPTNWEPLGENLWYVTCSNASCRVSCLHAREGGRGVCCIYYKGVWESFLYLINWESSADLSSIQRNMYCDARSKLCNAGSGYSYCQIIWFMLSCITEGACSFESWMRSTKRIIGHVTCGSEHDICIREIDLVWSHLHVQRGYVFNNFIYFNDNHRRHHHIYVDALTN